MSSSNDHCVREFDAERFELINHFRFPWPVNVSVLIFQLSFLKSIREPRWRTASDIWALSSSHWQHTSLRPDGKFVTVVGDHCDGYLVDSRDGKVFPFDLWQIELHDAHCICCPCMCCFITQLPPDCIELVPCPLCFIRSEDLWTDWRSWL